MASNEPLWFRMEVYHSADELTRDRDALELREALQASEELSDRLDRQFAWDARILDALHEVPVPSGLEQRLSDACSARSLDVSPARPFDDRPAHAGRRKWVQLTVAVSAVLVVAVSTLWMIPWRSDLAAWSTADWLREAHRVSRQIDDRSFRPVRRAVDGFPMDRGVRLVPHRAARVHLGQRPAVVYGGKTANGRSWTLVVVQVPQPVPLPSLPPGAPIPVSSGWCGAVWQSGSFVYVFRLQGNADDYRSIVEQGVPLA